MKRPYHVGLLDQNGQMMITSSHETESSRDTERTVCQTRIDKGEANKGGQVPTSIVVWEVH